MIPQQLKNNGDKYITLIELISLTILQLSRLLWNDILSFYCKIY